MTRIISAADIYADSLDFDMPFEGVSYFNLFGAADHLRRNLILDQPPITPGGVPGQGDGYAVFTSEAAYLNTLIGESAQITLMVLARAVGVTGANTTRPMWLSNFGGGTLADGGTSLFASDDDQVQGITLASNGGLPVFPAANVAVNPGLWGIRAVRITATQVVVDDVTAGLRATLALPYPRAVGTRKYRVGSAYSASYQGVSHIHGALIAPFALSDSQMAQMARVMRISAARHGIAA